MQPCKGNTKDGVLYVLHPGHSNLGLNQDSFALGRRKGEDPNHLFSRGRNHTEVYWQTRKLKDTGKRTNATQHHVAQTWPIKYRKPIIHLMLHSTRREL